MTVPVTEGALGNNRDDSVVDEICGYLTDAPSRSFFLFAGAGSGKTRTLIEVLRRLTGLVADHPRGIAMAHGLRTRGQAIKVITYTNNAVDVIRGRLGENTLVDVSTIHSFAWELIRGFDEDIREELLGDLQRDLAKAHETASGRAKGATAKDIEEISDIESRITRVTSVQRFTYSPDRRTFGEGALQHSQVLQLLATLLSKKKTLAQVLCDRHPIVLIDEAQDTMKGVLDALRKVAESPESSLTLGLLGDHRQRIYLDGHQELSNALPASWERPALRMNHRSSKRIVRLINEIWNAELPGRAQRPVGDDQHARVERHDGFVRLFVGSASTPSEQKILLEHQCALAMANITGDSAWRERDGFRVLTLEHKLAARRAGFLELALALEQADKDNVWDRGEAANGREAGPSPMRLFMDAIACLRDAIRADGSIDGFAAMALIQRHGRLRDLAAMAAESQRQRLRDLSTAINAIADCFAGGRDPTLSELARVVVMHDLFAVHEKLIKCLRPKEPNAFQSPDVAPESATLVEAWRAVLDRPWSEFSRYREYLTDRLNYGTHQGVKGSEYRHVQVILDDNEARGTLFSYDKLFGAKALSKTDLANASSGKETTIDRTLRLLYVTCSRPRESLAIVYWSESRDSAIATIKKCGWFDENEVVAI